MQLHAILGYFLNHKWCVDRELHFHVTIFLKNCACRTGIDLYLFFSFSRLVTCGGSVYFQSRTLGSFELPPKSQVIFFLYQGMLIYFVETQID